MEWGHSLRCVGVGFVHASWQDVEWLVPSLPIKTCVYQCVLCVVELGAHLVMLVLAGLAICVGYYGVYCGIYLECTWCFLCVVYMYSGAHLVQEGSTT